MRIFIILISLLSLLSAQDRVFLKLAKTKAYINEPILAKVTVIYAKKARYVTVNSFNKKLFYTKLINESNATLSGSNYRKTFTYLLFPQATGNINIEPRIAKVSTIQEKTGFVISNTLESKGAKLEVYATPNNLAISGNLNMHLKKLNKTAKVNEPTDFKLEITGAANIDDIKSFTLPLKGATYFSDKPKREYKIVKSKVVATFTQNFKVVSDNSYKIAPLKLTYFNTQTQLQESLLTKEQKVEIAKPLANKRELIFLASGLVLGFLLSLLLFFTKRKKEANTVQQAVKKAKNDKELYQILLPYSHKTELKETIKKLEANIYNKAKNRINKKEIIKVV